MASIHALLQQRPVNIVVECVRVNGGTSRGIFKIIQNTNQRLKKTLDSKNSSNYSKNVSKPRNTVIVVGIVSHTN